MQPYEERRQRQVNRTEAEAKRFQRYPGAPEPGWVPVPKWIRVSLGDELIADSRRVMLMRGRPPVYYFPREDVRTELLTPSEHATRWAGRGKSTYWHVEAGGEIAENGAWSYESPPEEAPRGLADYIAFDWRAMGAWFEEDEEVRVHPRDPYTRIDVLHSSRHVRVAIAGQTVAETRCPVLLFETGLPTRYYVRKTDVRMDLLELTDYRTRCPYKGIASHYSARIADEVMENIAWTYRFPNPEMFKIKDLIAFYNERLEDFFVDGEREPAPHTPWS
jgi:uncharacterized protein (DUF427 family)